MAAPSGVELKPPKLDIVVLGARFEERSALQRQFEAAQDQDATLTLQEELRGAGGRLPVFAIKDLVRNGKTISVGLVECADMGNLAAAINTAQIVVQHDPTLAIFSGIAGSLNADRFRIGDVFLPREVRTRYFQKLKVYAGDYVKAGLAEKAEVLGDINGHLQTYDRTIRVTDSAKYLLTHVKSTELGQAIRSIDIPQEWKVGSRGAARVVEEEASFCWDKVLSNKEYITRIRPILGGSATCIDMESYGFLSAINKLLASNRSATHGVIVRAISDYAEHKELSDSDPQWRELGLANMAIATRYIIQNVFSKVF